MKRVIYTLIFLFLLSCSSNIYTIDRDSTWVVTNKHMTSDSTARYTLTIKYENSHLSYGKLHIEAIGWKDSYNTGDSLKLVKNKNLKDMGRVFFLMRQKIFELQREIQRLSKEKRS